MKKEDFYYLSSDGKTQIHAIKWIPDKIVGVIQIAHGVTEYIDRYDCFAKFMVNHGYLVIGNDHLGHGKSIIENKSKMYIGPIGSFDYLVKDVDKLYNIIKEEYKDVPVYLMGFSLGSFVCRKYLIDYNPVYEKVFLIGTGVQPGFIINILKKIVLNEVKKIGEENTSDFINNLSFGTYNKQVKNPKTEYDWLTSDEEAIKEYSNDLNIEKKITGSLFYELINSIGYTSNIKNILKVSNNYSIILLSGSDDPVGSKGKGIIKLYKILKNNKFNVNMKLYDNCRHDLFHEVLKDEFFNDTLDYLKKEL